MKSIYILSLIAALGILTSAQAQDYASGKPGNSESETLEVAAGEVQTIFNTTAKNTRDAGCSLIQDPYRGRHLEQKKNGYKIVTENEDEIVEVKYSDGGRKLKYSNDYETLRYHLKENGKSHYKYSYYNECNKVKVRKNKKGITSVTNKSGMDTQEVSNNVQNAIKKGSNTCAAAAYAR